MSAILPPVEKDEAVLGKKPAVAAEAKSADKSAPAAKAPKADEQLMDTDDEAAEDKPVTGKRSESATANNNGGGSRKKKRRVIEDSDSEDEDDADDYDSTAGDATKKEEAKAEPMEVEEADAKKLESKKAEKTAKKEDEEDEEDDFEPSGDEDEDDDDLMADSDEEAEDAKPSAKSTKADAKSKKSINQVLKHSTSSTSAGTAGKKKSDAVAKGMLSNDQLLSQDTHPWKTGTAVPYAALCATFAHIESISSRLDIQQSLTTLFRKTILRNPTDMYQLIYLASNSVAPAYECIELGVGDSILIKAIGEASGTAPNMVKTKYESEGDLGTVASSAKAKQRTLGFGIKPKPLLAKEVLGAFKKIVSFV